MYRRAGIDHTESRRKEAGFTLIEVMFAVVFLSIGLLGIAAMQDIALSRNIDGRRVTVATNLGQARNVVLVTSADAVIAVGGSWGTVSEVAHAMRRGGIPVVSLGGWRIVDQAGVVVPGIRYVETPEEAVAIALAASSDPSN